MRGRVELHELKPVLARAREIDHSIGEDRPRDVGVGEGGALQQGASEIGALTAAGILTEIGASEYTARQRRAGEVRALGVDPLKSTPLR